MKIEDIFTISNEDEFNAKAVEVFRYQYKNTNVYTNFVNYLGISTSKINHYSQIPFLPIQFFKSHIILNKKYSPTTYFQSSGTTNNKLSKHFIAEESIYYKSILLSFKQSFKPPKKCIFLGLLPNYLEQNNSSLITMVKYLMEQSNHSKNGFYLNQHIKLEQTLEELKNTSKTIVLFGVSFALLDFIEDRKITNNNLIIIETGGMKGRKKEITKTELNTKLKKSFPNAIIASEYGMTELFSQAYAINSLKYNTPLWMRIILRELDDPFSYLSNNQTGGINIIDLANVNSCSFIATQDLGKLYKNQKFEILGRIDHSDIRGCSLLIEE